MRLRTSQRILVPVLGFAAIAASALAVHPSAGMRKEAERSPLLAGTPIDRGTLGIFERACGNCHSDRTEWPWYSHLPPASWLIQRDVRNARGHLNLSRWQQYTAVERQALLSAIGAAARSATMPPDRYLLLHPAGKLSAYEREQVYRWTRAERSRLRPAVPNGLPERGSTHELGPSAPE